MSPWWSKAARTREKYTVKFYNSLKENKGITFLLVFVLVVAITSVSFAIFNIVYSQLFISGELANSFQALFAADEGIEKMLYEDRVSPGDKCGGSYLGLGTPCYTENVSFTNNNAFGSRKCYAVSIAKAGGATVTTKMIVTGQYFCNDPRFVRRAFELNYTQ